MGLFDVFKKKGRDYEDERLNDEYDDYGDDQGYESKEDTRFPADVYYDDETYIRDFIRSKSGDWVQYEIVLDARNYNWDNMTEWADYMAESDLKDVKEVTTGNPPQEEENVTEAFIANGLRCGDIPEFAEEKGVLSIAGISKVLNAPMKIVWFNNTNSMRLFTTVDDALLVEKYTETSIRRTFDTEYEMKLGRPLAD